MAEREQVLLERGFVLHQRPYRDSSQLLECVTGAHGRMGLVARGSRRAATRQRALLQPFVPLKLSWIRRGDLGRLTHVEADGPSYALEGQRLLAGFYANELLLRLTARGDPNSDVFSCYSRCLAQLGEAPSVARTLRVFELELLARARLRARARRRVGDRRAAARRRELRLRARARVSPCASSRTRARISTRAAICWRCGISSSTTTLVCALRSGYSGECCKAHLGDRPLQSRLVLQDIVSRGL